MSESEMPPQKTKNWTRRGVLGLAMGATAAATPLGKLRAQTMQRHVPENEKYLPYAQTFGRMMSFLRDMKGPGTRVIDTSMNISAVPNLVGFVNDYQGLSKDIEFFASKPTELRSVHAATGKVLLFKFTYDLPGRPLSISATFDNQQFNLDFQPGQFALRTKLEPTMFPPKK